MSNASTPTQRRQPNEKSRPISATAAILGNKWHSVILYRLLEHESLGFNELQTEIEDISAKMLSEGLTKLENHGVVDRTIIHERPTRVEYSLTERGRNLQPILTAMRDWGQEYLARPST